MAIRGDLPRTDTPPQEPQSGDLADVLDVVLDKGMVIDADGRVSLVGIELLTIDAMLVVASLDTYLHYAHEVQRLEVGGGERTRRRGLAERLGHLRPDGVRSGTRDVQRGAGPKGEREALQSAPDEQAAEAPREE